MMASPGTVATCGATSSTSRPVETMSPHDAVGGCTPRPRNDSAASSRIALAMNSVAYTISPGMMLGRMWRRRTAAPGEPSARAAPTYSVSRSASTEPRTMRVPAVTRIVRGSVLALRETEYVGAARALGSPGAAVLRRHILPNIIPGLIVYATLFMANAILLEAALSFLGLGVQPPTASWGLMVSTGRDVLLVAPHVATVPGLAIMLAVLAFNLVGDGLRDALDPRLRGG